MRAIIALFCSPFLLASLVGAERTFGTMYASHAGDRDTAAFLQDILYGDGSGHMACQPRLAQTTTSFPPRVEAGPSVQEMSPERASGRSFATYPPPPRGVS
jgi:hypothetical protein